MLVYLIFVVSLAVLLIGSDWFIDSAEKIGLSFGISPFIIGVTIVAFGTSLPELATSIAAVMGSTHHVDTSEIVLGNIIGSNIANILLVFGLTVIVGKGVKLDFDIMNVDMPLLILSAFFLFFAVYDLQFTIVEAILFLAALGIFLYSSVSGSTDEESERPEVSAKNYLMVLIGGVMVFLGATYTIHSLEHISLNLGISPEIIALTVIAFGTSLPEVVVSISAARKGKHAIAVGNVLGSNIFNTYAVMSIPSFFGELTIPATSIDFGLPFMLGVTLLFMIMLFTKKVSPMEGMMLVLLYIFYIYQVL